jgi:GTP-binding protein
MNEAAEAAVEVAALEAGRLLFAQACDFVVGAARAEQLPPEDLPEVAFAGRSNVGKSSLINALVGRKALARTSNTPGRTREVNFFDLGHRLMLVDLPGFGYARAAKTEIRRWHALVDDYLRGRPALRRVALLLDARHGAKDVDLTVMARLDKAAVSYQVVLTKADKVKKAERPALLEGLGAALRRHPAAHPEILLTSAASGEGLPELRAALAALAEPAPVAL